MLRKELRFEVKVLKEKKHRANKWVGQLLINGAVVRTYPVYEYQAETEDAALARVENLASYDLLNH
jgi:hypothetical protein